MVTALPERHPRTWSRVSKRADPVSLRPVPEAVGDAAVAGQDRVDVERLGQHVHAQDRRVLGGPVAAVGPRRQHVLGAAAQAGGVEPGVGVEGVLRRHPRLRLVVGVEPAPLLLGERALHALVQQRAGALEPLRSAGVAPQPQQLGGALGVHQVVGGVLDVDGGAAHGAVVPAPQRQVLQPVGAGVEVVLPAPEPARRHLRRRQPARLAGSRVQLVVGGQQGVALALVDVVEVHLGAGEHAAALHHPQRQLPQHHGVVQVALLTEVACGADVGPDQVDEVGGAALARFGETDVGGAGLAFGPARALPVEELDAARGRLGAGAVDAARHVAVREQLHDAVEGAAHRGDPARRRLAAVTPQPLGAAQVPVQPLAQRPHVDAAGVVVGAEGVDQPGMVLVVGGVEDAQWRPAVLGEEVHGVDRDPHRVGVVVAQAVVQRRVRHQPGHAGPGEADEAVEVLLGQEPSIAGGRVAVHPAADVEHAVAASAALELLDQPVVAERGAQAQVVVGAQGVRGIGGRDRVEMAPRRRQGVAVAGPEHVAGAAGSGVQEERLGITGAVFQGEALVAVEQQPAAEHGRLGELVHRLVAARRRVHLQAHAGRGLGGTPLRIHPAGVYPRRVLDAEPRRHRGGRFRKILAQVVARLRGGVAVVEQAGVQGVTRIGGGDRQAAGEAQLDSAQRLAAVAPGQRHPPQTGSRAVAVGDRPGHRHGAAGSHAALSACTACRARRHGSRAVQGAGHSTRFAVVDLEHSAGPSRLLGGGYRESLREQRLEVEVAGAVAGLVHAPGRGRAVGLADVVHQDEAPVVLGVARRRVPAPRLHRRVVEDLQVGLAAAELGHVPAAPHQLQVALPGGGAHPPPAVAKPYVKVQAGHVGKVAAADQEVDAGAGDGEHLRLQLADQGAQVAVLAIHQAPSLEAGHLPLARKRPARRRHPERGPVGAHLHGLMRVERPHAGPRSRPPDASPGSGSDECRCPRSTRRQAATRYHRRRHCAGLPASGVPNCSPSSSIDLFSQL